MPCGETRFGVSPPFPMAIETKMKESRYNFQATLRPDKRLLLNGMTGALLEFDGDELDLATRVLGGEHVETNEENQGIMDALVAGGFVVDDGVDEVKECISDNLKECEGHTTLELDICPTYECNLRCAYCYTDFRSGRMGRDTESRVMKYLERSVPAFDDIVLSWFGGEPLLCADTVVRLSSYSQELVQRHGKPFWFVLLTNGVLLDQRIASQVFDAGVRTLHVTIDGPQEFHDKWRTNREGDPTYRTILRNLLTALMARPGFRINLRINVNDQSVDQCHSVIDAIPESLVGNFQIDISPIHNEAGIDIGGLSTPSPEVFQKINLSLRKAIEKGFSCARSLMPDRRITFCPADRHNNFQIGPDGALHKCSPGYKPEVSVGQIDDNGNLRFNAKYQQWHGLPPVSEYCSECRYLCFCGGGCRLSRLRKQNAPHCRDRFLDIENMIVNKYLSLTQSHAPRGELIAPPPSLR